MWYAYTSDTWPPLLVAFFLAALSLYCWRRRDVSAARPLAVTMLIGAAVMLAMALQTAAIAPATKIAWYKFQGACLTPGVTAGTCFVLEYARPGRWLTRRNLLLLALPPLLIILMIVMNNAQLIWHSIQVLANGAVVGQPTPANLIMTAYALGLVLVNAVALTWLFVRSPQHRWPAALILFGMLVNRGLFLHSLLRMPAPPLLDPIVGGALVTYSMYAIALFGFRILDPLPLARQVALEQMRDGMIVLDTQWRVAGMNRAAADALGISVPSAHGRPLAEVWPAYADKVTRFAHDAAAPIEVSIGTHAGTRLYTLELASLRDFRDLPLGYLLMLHDVTEPRRAQAHLLEQQWAQAILQEGEQLAHELHDGLSQNLAFFHMQAQAAQLYLESDQEAAAQASVVRLTQVSHEMQADVRELISNLLAVSLPSEGFCATLRKVLTQFEEHTGLPVTLDFDGPTDRFCASGALPPVAAVQIIRIIQEALANVRKHAGRPSQVCLEMRLDAGQLRIAITDNGAGFDASATRVPGRRFGLQVMRGRAERIGATLTVNSAPGRGTRVEMFVPVRDKQTGNAGVEVAR